MSLQSSSTPKSTPSSNWRSLFSAHKQRIVQEKEIGSVAQSVGYEDDSTQEKQYERKLQEIKSVHAFQKDQWKASIRDLEESLYRVQIRTRRISELEEQVAILETGNRQIDILQEQLALYKVESEHIISLENEVSKLQVENHRLEEGLNEQQLHKHSDHCTNSVPDSTDDTATKDRHDVPCNRTNNDLPTTEGALQPLDLKHHSKNSVSYTNIEREAHNMVGTPINTVPLTPQDMGGASVDDVDAGSELTDDAGLGKSSNNDGALIDDSFFGESNDDLEHPIGVVDELKEKLVSETENCSCSKGSIGDSLFDANSDMKSDIDDDIPSISEASDNIGTGSNIISHKKTGGVPQVANRNPEHACDESGDRKQLNHLDADNNSIGDSIFDIGSEPEDLSENSTFNNDSEHDDNSFGDSLFDEDEGDGWLSDKDDTKSVGDSLFDDTNTYSGDGSLSYVSVTSSVVTIEEGVQHTLRNGNLTRSQKMLAERKSCIDSIKWLGQHLSASAIALIISDIELEEFQNEQTKIIDLCQNEDILKRTTSIQHSSIKTNCRASLALGTVSPNKGSEANSKNAKVDVTLLRKPMRRWSMGSVVSTVSEIPSNVGIKMKRRNTASSMEEMRPDIERSRHLTAVREHRIQERKAIFDKVSNEMRSSQLANGICTIPDEIDTFVNIIPSPIPPATRHNSILLFVDISGFTKLSSILDVEPLSKTINAYFQMIIDEVEKFGGDVIKFAGDALFAEWKASDSKLVEFNKSCRSIDTRSSIGGRVAEECVFSAATCAANIVHNCSDYPVYSGKTSSKFQISSLNLRCGLACGEVMGLHAGDTETRMEYLIVGKPINEVTSAEAVAKHGEVAAAPSALRLLEKCADLDECVASASSSEPIIIASRKNMFFRAKRRNANMALALPEYERSQRQRLAERCNNLGLPVLKRLQRRISLYVHPVIVNDERAIKQYGGDHSRCHERLRSEAELRNVYTIFIMPIIDATLTRDDEVDVKMLLKLNDIMLTTYRELTRFNGQFRQFIIDDKGVVLIANFGLRGSTFPNMVAERALPFTTSIAKCLEIEQNVECRIGATYGKAYCGVVGSITRHEYAVLGPSVNLSARLMANAHNCGILVDDGVRKHAGGREFRALPPVSAKGYTELVPIFEPINTHQQQEFKDSSVEFVGREKERTSIVALAEEVIINGGSSKMVLVTADSGSGKNLLCSQITKQIEGICLVRNESHLISRNTCFEGDIFAPFSIAKLILFDILDHNRNKEEDQTCGGETSNSPGQSLVGSRQTQAMLKTDIQEADVSPLLVVFMNVCRELAIPSDQLQIICRIMMSAMDGKILTPAEQNAVVGNFVQIFLHYTIQCEMVVLALDDVSNMDAMSWRVLQSIFENSLNVFALLSSRLVTSEELQIDREFWETLRKEGVTEKRFYEIQLTPMQQSDMDVLVAKCLGREASEIDPELSRDIFVQSGGMPHLVSEIVAKLGNSNLLEQSLESVKWRRSSHQISARDEAFGSECLGELVLHRLDMLSASVRTHLNLAANLGSVFELIDVITAFERYRMVRSGEKRAHAKSVHQSLEEAVGEGVLEEVTRPSVDAMKTISNCADHPYAVYNVTYKFTHDLWRNNILHHTLDESKKDMQDLIASTKFDESFRKLGSLSKQGSKKGFQIDPNVKDFDKSTTR